MAAVWKEDRRELEFEVVSQRKRNFTSRDRKSAGMPTRVLRATAAALPRHGLVMDEALKAGIAATACSIFVLFVVLLAMLSLPLRIG